MTSEEVGDDFEHVEAQKKKFDDYQKVRMKFAEIQICKLRYFLTIIIIYFQDMRTIETRIKELTIISEKLKVEHRREYEMIQEIIKRLTERWEELQQLSEKRQQALESAQEIQKFHR